MRIHTTWPGSIEMPSRRLAAFLSACLVVLISSIAWADDREKMLELNEAGFEAFSEERYVDAAEAFEAAYEASPDAVLRKNEAIAWFKAGRCDEALTAANAFLLVEGTPVEDKKEARSVVANCKVELARQALDAGSFSLAETLLAEAESLEPDDYARDQIGMVRVEIAKAKSAAEDEDEVLTQEDEGMSDETFRTIGWILAGSGAFLTVTAFAYHMVTLSNQSELEDLSREGGDRKRFNDLQDSIGTARWAVPTLYVLGLGSGGAGATMLLISSPAKRGEAARELGMELPLAIGPALRITLD